MTHGSEQRQIWLASGSPRRKQLLEQMGLTPIVRVADVPEYPEPGESPRAYATRLAGQKGRAVRAGVTGAPRWLVAADTVVVLDGQLLEKPVDAADARRMLGALSGRQHEVITAFWIGAVGGDERTEAVSTAVRFRSLTEAEIAGYVRTGEPMDKAGAYGIQGAAGVFVDRIDGSYFNVVGLPITEVYVALRQMGAWSELALV